MKHPYQDPSVALEQRVEDLLSRMELPEKIGQMMQLDGRADCDELFNKFQPGSLLHINGRDGDGAINKSLATRLGIPVLLADDGIHGHSFWAGATIFPTQLAMACSWNTELMEQAARVTAREMRATGLKWTFSPVLCITRDLRWGRVNETFGEDPFLIGEFAAAMIKGYQAQGLGDPDAVLATAKHFAGYSETQGGRDASEADISRRKLRSWFLPPFERAAKAGCLAFMTGYQSIDGIPSTANKWLLSEVLRDEWGFKGIVVTDWNNVGRLVREQQVCADFAQAAAMAVGAGNDFMMTTPEFFDGALSAVANGTLPEAAIDRVVRRILALKFRMGLFENPGFSDLARIQSHIACPEHQAVNLEISRQSLVLLQNDGLLPLAAATLKSIAVIGPNADDPLSQLGDWSLGSGQTDGSNGSSHPRATIQTVLDGIRSLADPHCSVSYRPGCSIGSNGAELLPEALDIVAKSELVVMVLGDNLTLCGEEKSTATLELQGGQLDLAKAVLATQKPLALILINSKPLVFPPWLRQSRAILQAFNPGMQGGRAIAEMLFGLIEPVGKLTVSMPEHVGQQPVYYNQIKGQHGTRYADLSQDPAFPFGFGVSYTRFEFSELSLESAWIGQGQELVARVRLCNVGDRPGTEIVQLYIEDLVSSVTWAKRELKAYARVSLQPGQCQTVELRVAARELSIVDAEGRRVCEPGDFRVHVGNSSRESDCLAATFTLV